MKLPGYTFNEACKGCMRLMKALNTPIEPELNLSSLFVDTDKAVKGLNNLVNALNEKENKNESTSNEVNSNTRSREN